MSSRTTLRPQAVITAGDMSAATITSAVTILQSLTGVNYAVAWAGTVPVGTLAVQASDDYSLNQDGSVRNAGTWNTLPFLLAGALVTSAPVSGNSGNGMFDISGLQAYAVRLVYTKASGTGALTATITGKVS